MRPPMDISTSGYFCWPPIQDVQLYNGSQYYTQAQPVQLAVSRRLNRYSSMVLFDLNISFYDGSDTKVIRHATGAATSRPSAPVLPNCARFQDVVQSMATPAYQDAQEPLHFPLSVIENNIRSVSRVCCCSPVLYHFASEIGGRCRVIILDNIDPENEHRKELDKK